MFTTTVTSKRIIMVRFNPGDDILLGLREAAAKEGIKNAVILTGVGSVSSYHYHVISSTVNPPDELFTKGSAPLDVVNINGMILDGRVHAHIAFANHMTALGGHMEPGCVVQTFAVVAIQEMDNANFRDWDNYAKIL